MFRFESPVYLYCLLLVPLFVLLHYGMIVVRKRRLERFGDKELMMQLMPRRSRLRTEVKFWLCMFALGLACTVLARPQYGVKSETHERQGIEAIICLDISRSMLATDVAPSRLEKAKMLVSNLVDNMTDDKIGLIIFAGDAFTQLPITSDYVSAKMFLDGITPDLIKLQGTDIANALTIAMRSFTPDEESSKAIIIITDGENHEGGAEEAARQAAEKGINIFVLGIGSEAGSPVPVAPGSSDFIVDQTGNVVVSRLNQDMCRSLAREGQGAYIYVDNSSSAQKKLDEQIDKLGKTNMESVIYSEFDEQFQMVALILFIALLLEVCINEARNPLFKNISVFRRPGAAVILLMFGLPLFAQSESDHIRHGNRCYRDSDYVKAQVHYQKAIEANPKSALAYYNLACAQLRLHSVKEAVQSFETSVKLDTVKSRKAKSYHNMGVVMQSQKQFREAIECYKSALRNNPKDNETRYNLVLCQRQVKNDDQQNQQDQNQQNQDQQNQDQNQDQQNQDQQDQQQEQEQQQQQNQRQEEQMSQENAEQMLQAAMQDERQTQDKMQKMQAQPTKRRLEKEW